MALALASWFLMMAPRGPSHAFNPQEPISKWNRIAVFQTGAQCAQRIDQIAKDIESNIRPFGPNMEPVSASDWFRCIAANNPGFAK
jgi:hypothetical protein